MLKKFKIEIFICYLLDFLFLVLIICLLDVCTAIVNVIRV